MTSTDEFDIKKALGLLQSFGISPDQIGADRMENLSKLAAGLSDPSQITPELSNQILKTLGVSAGAKRVTKRDCKKIGRNTPCICESGKKYKKCCGC